MDHLFANEGKPIPENLSAVTESTSRPAGDAMDVDDEEDAEALKSLGLKATSDVEAKSIKCSECGKVFRNTALAQFHAEKSGHQEFEESTEEVCCVLLSLHFSPSNARLDQTFDGRREEAKAG